jgi:hypothetical protein
MAAGKSSATSSTLIYPQPLHPKVNRGILQPVVRSFACNTVSILLLVGATLLIYPHSVGAQSCVTSDEVKAMVTRLNSPVAKLKVNKKLRDELLKLRQKEHDLVQGVIKNEDGATKDLDKARQKSSARLCQILKEYGWPTAALVEPEGAAAAFSLFQNSPSLRFQLDLLPVIVAAVEKKEIDKPHFAALFDRVRLSAGMKQLFGTQASVVNGFLVLAPIEAEAQVDARRSQLDLPPLDRYLRLLERGYRTPLLRSPLAPARPARDAQSGLLPETASAPWLRKKQQTSRFSASKRTSLV